MEQTPYKTIQLPSPDYVQLRNKRETLAVGLMVRAPREQGPTHKERGAHLHSKHQGALSWVPASRKEWLSSQEESKIFTRAANSSFFKARSAWDLTNTPLNQSGVLSTWNLRLCCVPSVLCVPPILSPLLWIKFCPYLYSTLLLPPMFW